MEDHETRLKRLRLRSWHRGIKEMDLILGRFADTEMVKLNAQELDEYEIMMSENDHDLYQWVTGQNAAPERFSVMIARVATTLHKIE